MYRQHFGLTDHPLGKKSKELWDDGAMARLQEQFLWLLESPGIGLLTGEPGVGKTAAPRQITRTLNPHRYLVIYTAETDFGRLDIYRSLALALGLEPAYRRATLWRDIKAHIQQLADGKQLLPVWIIDEAQNLPPEFFRDFPAFLNFAFDSRNLMTVWLAGHAILTHTLDRAPYAAMNSRIQARIQLQPAIERERFAGMIDFALKQVGCQHKLLSDSGMELLRQSSRGLPRHAGRILTTAMRMAVPMELNHLPDACYSRPSSRCNEEKITTTVYRASFRRGCVCAGRCVEPALNSMRERLLRTDPPPSRNSTRKQENQPRKPVALKPHASPLATQTYPMLSQKQKYPDSVRDISVYLTSNRSAWNSGKSLGRNT